MCLLDTFPAVKLKGGEANLTRKLNNLKKIELKNNKHEKWGDFLFVVLVSSN